MFDWQREADLDGVAVARVSVPVRLVKRLYESFDLVLFFFFLKSAAL